MIKIKVENLGPLSSGTYTIAIDDFQMLDLSSLQEYSRRFDIGIVYVNLPWAIYYEAFFPEVLVEDGTVVTGAVGPAATFSNPVSTQYGTQFAGNIGFTYPFDTSVTGTYNDYKMTLRWQGGYSAVWANINTLTFGSYSKLWVNPMINQIVLLMPQRTLPYT